LPDRQVILAETQTAGHGRFQRKWVSHLPGNVYLSLVLKPDLVRSEDSPLGSLTQYLSLVICDVLTEYGVVGELKWPNDVLVNRKKISGILGEASFHNDRLRGYVLGVGINLNMPAAELSAIDQPATSLNLLLHRDVERDAFLAQLLERFFAGYDGFLTGGFASIRQAYEARSACLGQEVIVKEFDTQRTGIALGFSSDGSLELKISPDQVAVIKAGDMVLRG